MVRRVMDNRMTKEESYVERRKLFKNIWDTAMNMGEKGADLLSRPKVIKTLRLDEVDRINIGKSKKQRIKNLRNVCNRLLDFCDRQEADDNFYEQLANKADAPQANAGETKPKKAKVLRTKKKMKKVKSYPPGGDTKPVVRGDLVPRSAMKTAYPSVNRFKRTTVVKKTTMKNLNPKPSLIRENEPVKALSGDTAARRKVVKKNTSKRKQLNKAPQAVKISANSKP